MNTGFSDVIGSWKIIEMSLPRIFSSSLSVERGEVAALEEDARALRDPAGPVDQAHHRERGHGLAAARLADDAERAALRDLEVDPVDGAQEAVARVEPGAEVLDGEQRRTHALA